MSRPSSVAEAVDGTALRLAAAVAVLVLVLDQLTKWLILEVVMQPPRVIEVTGFLNLVLVKNPGISFGLLGGEAAWKAWLLSALATGIVVALAMWLRRRGGRMPALMVGLIGGGALGNVIDRLRFGAVMDFIDVYAGSWHWPAFNVADSAITVGVAVLIVHGLFFDEQESK